MGDEYFSICSYSCEQGYGLEPGVVSTLVCLSYNWTGSPVTECTDNESPVLSGCESQPLIHRFFLPANESASVFNWTVPIASDNGGEELKVTEPTYPKPGVDELEANYYSLTYSVTDNNGNIGTCSVLLIVSEIRCDPLPIQVGLQAFCSHGNLMGSFCHFSCIDGYYLEGDNHAKCQQRNSGSKQGDWSNPTSKCTEVHCDPAPGIENGFLSFGFCDTRYLSICVYECSEGYIIRNRILQCIRQPGSNSAFWIAPGGDGPVCEGNSL
nr:sushi, von Willebrand factor type A, EGF and pentraxin domain-containing protein 1-like [Lytechinus pictus]